MEEMKEMGHALHTFNDMIAFDRTKCEQVSQTLEGSVGDASGVFFKMSSL